MNDITTTQKVTATTLYDITDTDNLFASDEQIAELQQQGKLSYEFTARAEGQASSFDRSYMYHRVMKFGSAARIEWRKPLTKELIEAGYEENEINIGDPNQHIVAVRGVPISFNYGFRFSTDNGKKTLCQTSRLIEHKPDGTDVVTNSSNPLRMPVKSPYWSKKKPDQLNWVLERQPQLELVARRLEEEAGTDEKGEPIVTKKWVDKKCAECVAAQEYTNGTDNCGVSGYLLFCVFEVGIMDSTLHIQDPINNPVQVRWVPINEAGLLAYDGTPLNHPFTLRLEGLGASQLNNVGMSKEKYEIPVILPSHLKAKQRKTCYLPDNNVMSAGQFYDWVTNPNAADGRSAISAKGSRLMTTITELYITALHEKVATKDFIPVFRPVATGRNTVYKGHKIQEYVQTAVAVMNAERSEAENAKQEGAIEGTNGNGDKPVLAPINVDAGSSSAVESVVNLNPTSVAAATASMSASDKIKNAALNAYSVPKA